MVDQWKRRTAEAAAIPLAESGEIRSYELPLLEQQLYRWSIEGTRRHALRADPHTK